MQAINAIDVYKSDHKSQYPDGTQKVYSTWIPRSLKHFTGSSVYDGKVVHFYVQAFIKDFLIREFNETFFNVDRETAVGRYKRRLDNALGKDAVDVTHIGELHDLGYLPLRIKSLPEGVVVNPRICTTTIQETIPEFFWLVNYIETVFSAENWKPSTVATITRDYMMLGKHYADMTSDSGELALPFQFHDFSFRGMSNRQDAAHAGMGHLLSSCGTDTIPAIDAAEEFYNADSDKELIGASVPATEHSVMCMGGAGTTTIQREVLEEVQVTKEENNKDALEALNNSAYATPSFIAEMTQYINGEKDAANNTFRSSEEAAYVACTFRDGTIIHIVEEAVREGGTIWAHAYTALVPTGKFETEVVSNEVETIKRLVTHTYPSGIVSIVSDTWDFWKVITEYLPLLKPEILNRKPNAQGLSKVVIRPDSGNPVDIICGLGKAVEVESTDFYDIFDAIEGDDADVIKHEGRYYVPTREEGGWADSYTLKEVSEAEVKGAIECLWDTFGGTVNSKGYKELDPCIGLIYGDSITITRAEEIFKRLEAKGFASTNVVLGIGSYTYQMITRDTFGYAMKATAGVVNGEFREIFKDPATDDGTKKSAKGFVRVELENGEYVMYDQQTAEQEQQGELRTVFLDGELLVDDNFSDIRKRLANVS